MSRFRVLLLLLSGLPLGSCGSSADPEPATEVVTGVAAGAIVLHAAYSGFGESERFVVRDSVHWGRVWATAIGGQSPVPPRPAIDFAKDMIVVAALGSRRSGGYDIAIESVTPEAAGATVHVVATAPGDDCFTTAAITQPLIMVRTGAVAGPVRFDEQAQTLYCR